MDDAQRVDATLVDYFNLIAESRCLISATNVKWARSSQQYVGSIGGVICDLDYAIVDVYERLWTSLLTYFPD